MKHEHLHKTLERLHEEIEATDFVDERDAALLRELMGDIRGLLDASEAKGREEQESLGERLRDAVERIEESHPTLAANIRRVADAFGRLAV